MQLWQVGLPKLAKSLCLCYHKYRKGASDRRLPLKLLVMKNNRQFARLGGYFFAFLLISIPNLMQAMHKLSKAITSSISISKTSLLRDFQ